MTDSGGERLHERWAHFRFSVIGPLLAAPPDRSEIAAELRKLAEKEWTHPIGGAAIRFAFSTIEAWYYRARNSPDPVAVLLRKPRRDRGRQTLSDNFRRLCQVQYSQHQSWSYQLHYDNLTTSIKTDPTSGPLPSYSTFVRFMQAHGLRKRKKREALTEGQKRALHRLEQREVRSYEAEYVHGLWHLDFHFGSRKIVTSAGEWLRPALFGVLDDHSRLACHVQWYLTEDAENLVHGLSQAIQKRGLPRSLMTDNGSAMEAEETKEGLLKLSVIHEQTLCYSPYQNGKQERFWAQVEGRLMSMLEGIPELTLRLLNETTQAWVEQEYNRKHHDEIGRSPLSRFLESKDVGRDSPSSAELKNAFRVKRSRKQRRTDGTISLEGRRFEIPSRYRALLRPAMRLARWDLSNVHLVDPDNDTLLCPIYPLDKARHAHGLRRHLQAEESAASEPSGMAPLLKELLADYAATGFPPAFIPKDEAPNEEEER